MKTFSKIAIDTVRRGVRQGDVLIVPVSKIPDTALTIKPSQARHILAEGEQTGHHHAIAASPAVNMLAMGGRRFLDVRDQAVMLQHEEHDPLTIEPGNYEVRIQRQETVARASRVLD